MDFATILQAVSSVGFPIVAFFYCFYQNNKQHENDMTKLTSLTEAVNNNTMAIAKLVDHLEEKKEV